MSDAAEATKEEEQDTTKPGGGEPPKEDPPKGDDDVPGLLSEAAKEDAQKADDDDDRPAWADYQVKIDDVPPEVEALLAEQFYDPDTKMLKLPALGKSWKDFRRDAKEAKSARAPKSAEDYTLPDALAETSPDDPLLAAFRTTAHENGLSQKEFEGVALGVLERIREHLPDVPQAMTPEQKQEALIKEKEALGPKAEERVGFVLNQGKKMMEIGVWSKDDFDEIIVMGSTARGVAAMEKVFSHFTRSRPIPRDAVQDGGLPSKQELDEMVGSEKYQKDSKYRREVRALFEKVYGKQAA